MNDEPTIPTLRLDPHVVPEGEKISPDGKVMRVQIIRATVGDQQSRITCQDGTVYINNGRGQLLNPGRAMRKAAAKAKRKR